MFFNTGELNLLILNKINVFLFLWKGKGLKTFFKSGEKHIHVKIGINYNINSFQTLD